MRFAVRDVRNSKGLTIDELVERSGISKNVILKLEDNSVDTCNSKILTQIASALKVSVSQLFLK